MTTGVTVDFNANLARFTGAIDKATNDLNRFQSNASRISGNISKSFAALGVGLSAGAFAAGIKSVIDGADQLQKASQKYGVAVEQLSALQYAGKLADVSLEAIGNGLKKLSVNMSDTAAGTGEAKDAFKALGISVKDIGGGLKSSDAVLAEIADRFAGMEDGAGKTALAVKFFGRAGHEMIPLLNAGSKGLAEMKTEAEALGVIIGGDLARKSEEFNDNLTRLNTVAEAFKITVAQGVMPVLNEMLEDFIRQRKETIGLSGDFNLLGEGLKATVVFFGNVSYVLKGIGIEIGGISAQIAALSRGDFTAFSNIGKMMKEDAAKARSDLDAWEKRILSAGGTSQAMGDGTSRVAAPILPDDSALKKAAAEAKRAAEKLRKAFEDATQAIYDNALAASQADAEIEKLRNHYTDLVDPAAATMRELAKFEELVPALGLSADAVERIRDAFREKIDVEQYGEPLKDITEEIAKQNDLAHDLGLTFQSAFEDAVVAGKKFSDVLKGLAQDIARIVLRKTVTEPLAKSMEKGLQGGFGDLLKGFGFGGSSSTISAPEGMDFFLPSYATGTPYVPQTGLALLHQGERVVPAEQNKAGGAISITVNVAPGTAPEIRRAAGQGAREAVTLLGRARRYA